MNNHETADFNNHSNPAAPSAHSPSMTNGNGEVNNVQQQNDLDRDDSATPPAKRRKRSSGPDKDVRVQCDKCSGAGDNSCLVRCDECKKCFHFSCLVPPLKKSPKVAGYGWHCSECDPDYDTDWHLDWTVRKVIKLMTYVLVISPINLRPFILLTNYVLRFSQTVKSNKYFTS